MGTKEETSSDNVDDDAMIRRVMLTMATFFDDRIYKYFDAASLGKVCADLFYVSACDCFCRQCMQTCAWIFLREIASSENSQATPRDNPAGPCKEIREKIVAQTASPRILRPLSTDMLVHLLPDNRNCRSKLCKIPQNTGKTLCPVGLQSTLAALAKPQVLYPEPLPKLGHQHIQSL